MMVLNSWKNESILVNYQLNSFSPLCNVFLNKKVSLQKIEKFLLKKMLRVVTKECYRHGDQISDCGDKIDPWLPVHHVLSMRAASNDGCSWEMAIWPTRGASQSELGRQRSHWEFDCHLEPEPLSARNPVATLWRGNKTRAGSLVP